MAIQSMGTAAARNQMKAAAIPSKVAVGSGHGSTVTAAKHAGKGPGSGAGMGMSHGSSVKGSMHGAAPAATGSKAVRGFTGTGTLNGKV